MKYKFKKGDRVSLDEVYDIQALIPNDAYDQDDYSDYVIGGDNDSGESILFLKNVTITVNVKVS